VDNFDDNQQITFDTQGRIIEFVSYRKGKRPTTIKKTSYDAKGRLTKEILSIAAEDLTQTTIYEYDDIHRKREELPPLPQDFLTKNPKWN
jgi:hypothetical protein